MTIKDKIIFGSITQKELSELITENEILSKSLHLRLSWSFTGTRIRSRIFDGDQKIKEKFYDTGHTHKRLALLHSDWYDALITIQKQRSPARRRKGDEETGNNWSNLKAGT